MATAMVTAQVQALAQADFSGIAARFADAGFGVSQPARGILQIAAPQRTAPMRLLLSVGVHGDETGPIEMLAQLLDETAAAPQRLALDLMVVVGNLDAIAQGRRFIDADMNRMFRAERGDLATAGEAARADQIMQATEQFFAGSSAEKWHLDLHTAIRPSHYPTFAIVPDLIPDAGKQALCGWMAQAGIGAIVMNPTSAGTYSSWTATSFGTIGSTVELGRIGTLGQNDMALFAAPKAALQALLYQDAASAAAAPAASQPQVFRVAQQIIKLSDAFSMSFDHHTQNFTTLPRGTVIATDGATVYQVEHEEEAVIFPNPDVRIGQRTGLMVVRQE